jgi:hypothetical protein
MTTATFFLLTICSFILLGGIIYGLYYEGIIIEFANIKIYKQDTYKVDRQTDGNDGK